MCDPVWIYGIVVTPDSLSEYAKAKAPECIYDGDDDTTATLVVEKFGYHFGQMLLADIAIDVFDEKLEPQLVLVLHQDYPDLSKFTPEDEEYIRKELGIKEKGKWYRYAGSFFLEDLDTYRKTVPQPIPSRVESVNVCSNESSSDITRLSRSIAAVSV